MTTLCHLSGLHIKEGRDVLIVPISCSTPVYSAYINCVDDAVDFAHYPMKGKMGSFGLVHPHDGNEFRHFINANLAHKTQWFSEGKRGFTNSQLFATVKDGDKEIGSLRGEWIDTRKVASADTPEKRAAYFHTTGEFNDDKTLFETLQCGSIIQLNEKKAVSLSYLTIDLAFFEQTCQALLERDTKAQQDDIRAFLLALVDDAAAVEGSERYLVADRGLKDVTFYELLAIFINTRLNEDAKSSLLDTILDLCDNKTSKIDIQEAIEPWVDKLSTLSSLIQIYQSLGKTFFPQLSGASLQKQHAFFSLLNNESARRVKALTDEDED